MYKMKTMGSVITLYLKRQGFLWFSVESRTFYYYQHIIEFELMAIN